MDATICVGTFGSQSWVSLAVQRAIPSAQKQGVPVIHKHEATLATARNAALSRVETEFVVFLDADDELDENYLTEMAKGTADLRAPAKQTYRRGEKWGPCVVPQVWGHSHKCVGKCLRYGNWIVIGACVRTDLVRSVGGFEEFGWSEDYALWARCWKAGATVESIPTAIYMAHAAHRGRNRVPIHVGLDWHRKIEAAVWPDEPSVL